MVQLLLKGALRIQDIVGPTFKSIKDIRPNKQGFIVMHFDAKKTTAKSMPYDQDAYDAVITYQKSIRAEDDAMMFPPGEGPNPASKYSKWLTTFFKKNGEDVQSHDFRTTAATRHYNKTKDIMKTQKFIGHASSKTTERYIKLDEQQLLDSV